MQRYPMQETLDVAKQAMQAVSEYLEHHPDTVSVENVEAIAAYWAIDVDLLWTRRDDRTWLIEVKGDRYYQTGNYFFETISNQQRGTPGCFLYTEAHWVFYYFVDVQELHILPMPAVRDWFLERQEIFVERPTSTPTRDGESYITVGRLVPREQVHRAFPDMEIVSLRKTTVE